MHKILVYDEYSRYNCIMKLCIVINDGKKKARDMASEFIKEATDRSIEHYVFSGEISEGTNAAVVFGGDGTILKFIRTGIVNVPVLGINCGKVGFLAESARPASETLDKLVLPDLVHGVDGIRWVCKCVESADKGGVWVDFE